MAPLTYVFDGDCGLCDSFVRFVLRHDEAGAVTFAPYQSAAGSALLATAGVTTAQASASMVTWDGSTALLGSDALAAILRRLGNPWRLGRYLNAIPKSLREAVYRVIASRRTSLGGHSTSCTISDPTLRARWEERVLGP